MTKFQAQKIINDRLFVDAFVEYSRQPMKTDEQTFRKACLWIDAANILTTHHH